MLQKIAVLSSSKPELKVQVGGNSLLGSQCSCVLCVCVCQWMLMLAAYVFLLRVPSEALPASVHVDDEGKWPVLSVRPDVVEIWLPRRKNRLTPSTIVRSCWCHVCRLTCPVHVLGEWLGELQPGTRPFAHISPHDARSGLRLFLAAIGVEDAHLYWSHDLRRGHADDLREAGADAAVICAAGDWKSGAYLHYQDLNRREAAAVRKAYVVASSDEDEAPAGAPPLLEMRWHCPCIARCHRCWKHGCLTRSRHPSVRDTRMVRRCMGNGVASCKQCQCRTKGHVYIGVPALVRLQLGWIPSAVGAHFPTAWWVARLGLCEAGKR